MTSFGEGLGRLILRIPLVVVIAVIIATGTPVTTGHAEPVVDDAISTSTYQSESFTDILDAPIEFSVINRNGTRGPCGSDNAPYTIRGHLTAPATLRADPDPAVTLLIHGTNTGEWIWRLDLDGRNYARELAKRGFASVTIDRPGYGSSDIPDGFASCSGAHADIAHQIVQQLRDASYRLAGETPVAFETIVIGGHSSGALVAESVAASFGNVDGLLLTGWAAVGITDDTNRRFLQAYRTCLEGGEERSAVGDPTGYVYFDPTLSDFLEGGLSAHADPAVVREVETKWSRNPCGVMVSEPMAILYDLDLIDEIEVPVFIAFGAHDVLRQGVEGYPRLFTSSSEVTTITLPNAGHFVTIDDGAETLYDSAADWLARHFTAS